MPCAGQKCCGVCPAVLEPPLGTRSTQQAAVPTRTQTRATSWRILPKTRRRGPRGGARLPQWPVGQPNGGGVEMGREVGLVPPMCWSSLALRRQTARTQIPRNAGQNQPKRPYSATHKKKGGEAYSTAVFSNTVSQLCRTGKPGGRFQPHCYKTQPSTQANCYTQLHHPSTQGGCCALT